MSHTIVISIHMDEDRNELIAYMKEAARKYSELKKIAVGVYLPSENNSETIFLSGKCNGC